MILGSWPGGGAVKIKYQLVFLVLLTVFGFSATEYAIQNLIVLPSFQRLEDVKARTNLARCVAAIENEVSHLDQVCNDWAAWSDTYDFMRTGSGDYIEANLVDTSFTDNNLNLICLVANDNQVAWSRTVDLENMEDFSIRMFPGDRFGADSPVLAHTRYREGDTQGVAGIVITEKGPMLMASRPILTSNREGPARGTLIMGTLLTERYVSRLSRQVQVPFRVSPAAGPAGRETVLERKGKDSILARASVPGLNRKAALDVIATLDTSILAMGRKTTRYAMYSGIVSGLGILFFLMFFMQRRVLMPLSGLAGKLTEIGNRGDMGARLAMKRRDEIGVVACEFDRMMDQLEEKSHELVGANEALRMDQARRLEVEKALRKSENYYRRVLFGMHEEIFIIGPDHRITDVNKPHMDSVDRGREEILGQPCHRVFHGRDGSCTEDCGTCVLDEVMETGTARQYRHQHRRADGLAVWVDVLMSPLRDEDGRFLGVISAMRDVTQEVEMEKTVRQKSKMEAIGTLAGGIAHDFNNILSAILGYSQLASYELPAEGKAHGHLDEVMRAGERAKELVKRILAFTRRSERELKPVNLNEVMRDALKLMRGGLPATIEIVQDLEESVPPVWADTTEIHQVVMNLCTNAFHAMQKQGGTLTARLHVVQVGAEEASRVRGLAAGEYACIEIADTGTGMDEGTLARIFEPFFTTKPPGEGTGMGLSTVEGIVRSCGGAIAVESRLGEGTRFRTYLRPAAKGAEDRRMPSLDTLDIQPTLGARVLCVDDEPAIVKVQSQQLEKLGYNVVACDSPTEALDKIREAPEAFDLLVTDQTMPKMTGLQLAQSVHSINPSLPVVLCTGFSSEVTESNLKAAGVAQCLDKPVSFTDLVYTVHAALQPESREEPPASAGT